MKSRLFAFDYRDFLENHPKLFRVLSTFTVVFFVASVSFTFFDLFFDNASSFTILIKEKHIVLSQLLFDRNNPEHLFFIGIAVVFVIYGTCISILDFLWIRRTGRMNKFLPVFFAHLSSTLLLLLVIDFIFELAQIPIKSLFHYIAIHVQGLEQKSTMLTASLVHADAGLQQHTYIIDYIFAGINNRINALVPTLLYLPPFGAFILTILVSSFFEYGVHWLDHKSRFLWLVNHRIHHTAEHMHPMGVGVVDVFPKLFVGIPKTLLLACINKLFYHNALFEYFLAYNILYIFTQYFNHSTYYYEFFSKRPRLSMMLFLPHSNGTIHYVHHSALPGDDAVNLSSGGFCIWDFVFGTFRTPYKERPPVGLTNNPSIRLNPLSLLLSGWQQLFYEWKHNKNWRIRLKIIFGDIWYKPPVTKDFLKLSGEVS